MKRRSIISGRDRLQNMLSARMIVGKTNVGMVPGRLRVVGPRRELNTRSKAFLRIRLSFKEVKDSFLDRCLEIGVHGNWCLYL